MPYGLPPQDLEPFGSDSADVGYSALRGRGNAYDLDWHTPPAPSKAHFVAPPPPPSPPPAPRPPSPRRLRRSRSAPAPATSEDIQLALRMLSALSIIAPRMVYASGLLNERVVVYLGHQRTDVRMHAVKAAGEMLLALLPAHLQQRDAETVLARLLGVAAADEDPRIRLAALTALKPQLDHWLAQMCHVRLLACACYDTEDARIREESLQVLRRVYRLNPAVVGPALRRRFVNTIHELQHSGDISAQHDAAELLGRIMLAAPPLARTYAVTARDVLLQKLTQGAPVTLLTKLMQAVESLATAASGAETACLDEALPLIVQSIEESKSSLQRRLGSLNCLAALLRATDFRVHPYDRFPLLIGLLLRILQAPQPNARAESDVRLAVLRCLGIAGAYQIHPKRPAELLPAPPAAGAAPQARRQQPRRAQIAPSLSPRWRGAVQSVQALIVDEPADSPALLPPGETSNQPDSFFPTVATSVMLRVIHDQGLASNHRMAIGAIVAIFRSLGPAERPKFVPRVYPPLVGMLGRSRGSADHSFVSFQVQQMRVLTDMSGVWARPHLPGIVSAAADLIDLRDPALVPAEGRLDVLQQVVALIADLRLLFVEDFRSQIPRVVPVLAYALAVASARGQLAVKVLAAVEALGPQSDGYLTLLVPPLLEAFREASQKVVADASSGAHEAVPSTAPCSPVHRASTQDAVWLSPSQPPRRSSSYEQLTPLTRSPSAGAMAAHFGHDAPPLSLGPSAQTDGDAALRAAVRSVQTFAALAPTLNLREFAVPFLHACMRVLSSSESSPEPAVAQQPRRKNGHNRLRADRSGSNVSGPRTGGSTLNGEDQWLRDVAAGVPPIRILETEIVTALCAAFPHLQPEACVLEPGLTRVVSRKGLDTELYRTVVQGGGRLPVSLRAPMDGFGCERDDPRAAEQSHSDLMCNSAALQKVWDVSLHGNSAGEWTEWLRVFSLTLLRESPSPSLRACSNLAQVNLAVSRQLFNYAFVSCYMNLAPLQRKLLLGAVVVAIQSPSLPLDVLQPLLSLAEFMEHIEVAAVPKPPQNRMATPGCAARSVTRAESCRVYEDSVAVEESVMLDEVLSEQCTAASPGSPGLLETTATDVLRVGRVEPPAAAVAAPSPAPAVMMAPVVVAPPLPLPPEFDIEELASKAERCRMYAKALHYRELLFVDHLKRELGGLFGQYTDCYVVPFTPLRGRSDIEEKTWQGWMEHIQRIIRIHQHLSDRPSAQGILAFSLANFERVVFFDGTYKPRVEAKIYEELHEWHAARDEWMLCLQAIDGRSQQGSRFPSSSHSPLHRDVHELLGMSPTGPDHHHGGLLSTQGRSLAFGPAGSLELGPPATSLVAASLDREPGTLTASLGSADDRDAARSVQDSPRHVPPRHEVVLGLVTAQCNLGEWHEVLRLGKAGLEQDHGAELAPVVAHAAWMLQDWGTMEQATDLMDSEHLQTQIHQSVLALQRDRWEAARVAIHRARQLILPDLGPLAAESYSRAYPLLVKLQVLTELEEIAMWKERGGLEQADPGEVSQLLQMWTTRILHIERRVSFWEEVLATRRVLVPPHMHMRCWLKLVTTARKVGKVAVAENTLRVMLGVSECDSLAEVVLHADPSDPGFEETRAPALICATAEYLWHAADCDAQGRRTAEFLLSGYLDKLCDNTHSSKYGAVKARYHRKLGEWMQEQHPDTYWQPPHRGRILKIFRRATIYDANGWKNWHRWALMNHRIMRRSRIRDYRLIPYVTNAAVGFMKTIQCGSPNCIQDLLRIIGLWFAHGHIKQVEIEMRHVFLQDIATEHWLSVVPQLVARLQHSNVTIRTLVQQLLVRVGKDHPQACMYPLFCVMASEDSSRARCGRDVLERIKAIHPVLLQQGEMVAKNLTQTALIRAETWMYGMDEARWLFYTQRDPHGMFRVLFALHAQMDKEPTSAHECAFRDLYADQLDRALRALESAQQLLRAAEVRFGITPGTKAAGAAPSSADGAERRRAALTFYQKVEEAWQVYQSIHTDIERRLYKIPTLDLSVANPTLTSAKDLVVAIPGSYTPTGPLVRVSHFEPQCYIIPSKQRPRRIVIWGTDGRDYSFLLKGREDLRQDERVMQLFRLINHLLIEDHSTVNMPRIELYAVIPLASSAGLIGWMSNAQTLFQIIKEYRRGHKLLMQQEKSLIPNMVVVEEPSKLFQEYDKLSCYQKVDVFESILEQSTGDDLARMFWLKSRSSEVWLANRTTYTQSLAVMSMVGFILGLGDRHPSNLMLARSTRKVIHIDFGDCFEVASRREKYPEKVPFRLTRMLIKAMDLAGIEGSFRRTSENVMRVLRKNKDSLMSILASFLHDPLINWRLVGMGQQQIKLEATRAAAGHDEGLVGHIDAAVPRHLPADNIRHRSVREQMVRSIISRHGKVASEDAVTRHAILALNRIRKKLDGLTFKMGADRGADEKAYNFDYYDPLFVGKRMAINAPPTLRDDICGECELVTASIRCDECNDAFCDKCCDHVHTRRRNQSHTSLHQIERNEDSVRVRLKQLEHVEQVETLPPAVLTKLLVYVTRLQAAARGFLVRSRRRSRRGGPLATPEVDDEADAEEFCERDESGGRAGADLQTPLSAAEQVTRLISQATAHENLAQAYHGWSPFW
eukprot:TRINITY_DN2087_c0_g2_i6.p1 TRINITY_DN2087_c0_g2~~TRINITY_DN2087_c0_g2_i6.p1  ORF type:complete len:2721 (+),score=805.36 TRINITY_DN2087_c0_g2_i6:302-8164(+)